MASLEVRPRQTRQLRRRKAGREDVVKPKELPPVAPKDPVRVPDGTLKQMLFEGSDNAIHLLTGLHRATLKDLRFLWDIPALHVGGDPHRRLTVRDRFFAKWKPAMDELKGDG